MKYADALSERQTARRINYLRASRPDAIAEVIRTSDAYRETPARLVIAAALALPALSSEDVKGRHVRRLRRWVSGTLPESGRTNGISLREQDRPGGLQTIRHICAV